MREHVLLTNVVSSRNSIYSSLRQSAGKCKVVYVKEHCSLNLILHKSLRNRLTKVNYKDHGYHAEVSSSTAAEVDLIGNSA